MKINIHNKEYEVIPAKSEEELSQGLKGVKNLEDNTGMLFFIPDIQKEVHFTTKGMQIPIDMIFINLDLLVVDLKENALPGIEDISNSSSNMEEGDYIAYVLETNPHSGIDVGDVLDFGEAEPVMKVLAPDGSTLMDLWGGERIFSRKHTIVLIRKAKKANKTKEDKDYKALGRYVFKCILLQNKNKPEYVEAPK